MARYIISLREAGERLARPGRPPISPQRVRQLVKDAGLSLVPLESSDRRYRTGIAIQTISALKRRRANR
jgi:hypothetical protein